MGSPNYLSLTHAGEVSSSVITDSELLSQTQLCDGFAE